jgi:hypothetical protein
VRTSGQASLLRPRPADTQEENPRILLTQVFFGKLAAMDGRGIKEIVGYLKGLQWLP